MNRVMLPHRMRSLDTLRLTFHEVDCDEFNKLEFETWIATAIERNVRNLDLRTNVENFVWPLPLFTCKTLVHLKLWESTLPRFSGPVSLPSLKKFSFHHIFFSPDEAIPHLLPGCPVLDEFAFEWHDFEWGEEDCFKTCVAIRRLGAHNYSRGMEIKVGDDFDMKLVFWVASHISASMITSLVEAKVEIFSLSDECNIVMLMRLLNVLCQVKCLNLSLDLQSSSKIQLFPRFDNCTRLELVVDRDVLVKFLVKFLESAKNLEVLITRNTMRYIPYLDLGWTEPKQVPTCLLSCLGTIRIEEFKCTDPEFEMVRYILMHARVLKQMEIHISKENFGLEARLNAMRRLALFRRGSEACELVIN